MKTFLYFILLFVLVLSIASFAADSSCTKVVTLGDPEIRPDFDYSYGNSHFLIHYDLIEMEQFAIQVANYADYAWQRSRYVD